MSRKINRWTGPEERRECGRKKTLAAAIGKIRQFERCGGFSEASEWVSAAGELARAGKLDRHAIIELQVALALCGVAHKVRPIEISGPRTRREMTWREAITACGEALRNLAGVEPE